MDIELLMVEELMRRSVEVATFAHALFAAAGHHAWEVVEPHAAVAWEQVAGDAVAWAEIRAFVREVWMHQGAQSASAR